MPSREIAEPRHLTFAGPKGCCYGSNEKDYTVTAYHFDTKKGTLSPFQIVPTCLIPSLMMAGKRYRVCSGGRFVYVSNRKADLVSVFAADPATGKLSLVQWIPTKGKQPRFIGMVPDGSMLVAANELGASIRIFDVDPQTGRLHDGEHVIKTHSPVCVTFAL